MQHDKALNGYREITKSWLFHDNRQPTQKRRLLIIETVLKEAEKRNLKTSYVPNKQLAVTITKGQDKILFGVRERQKRAKQKVDSKRNYISQEYENVLIPTGKLVLFVDPGYKTYLPAELSDRENIPLEHQFENIMSLLERALAAQHSRRLKKEEWNRQYQEKAKEQARLEKEQKNELQRRAALETKVLNYKKAQDIRGYIEDVQKAAHEKRVTINEEALLNWVKWAHDYADKLDAILINQPI
jgi:hypothetical protein